MFIQHRRPLLRSSIMCSVLTSLITLGPIFTAAASPDLVILQNGEPVGFVKIQQDAKHTLQINYEVEQNARGAKLDVQFISDEQGYPLDWRIQGTSLMGGSVNEYFIQDGSTARWESQADAGEVSAESPAVYISNDGTPWELGLYARLLLQQDSKALNVLPGGSMAISELDQTSFQYNDHSVPVTLYKISGINLSPDYLLLDANQELFAVYGRLDSMVLQQDYIGLVDELATYFSAARLADIEDMQQGLAHRAEAPVYINNARVLNIRTGTLSKPSVVRIEDEKITDIQPMGRLQIPSNVITVDAEGGTLVPGLYDMHSHTSDTSGLYYLAAGVTGTRDMGNNHRWLESLLAEQDEGRVIGPHIYRTGFIEGRSEYNAQTGIIADTLQDALDAVRWYAGHNYPQIKLYNSIHPEWVEPMVALAHELGIRVSGHVPAFVSPDQVIEWGYNDIAHMNQLVLGWLLEEGEDTRTTLRLTAMQRTAMLDLESDAVRHTIQLMKDNNVALDTTLVILERLMGSRAGAVPAGDIDYLDHAPIGYQRYRKRTFVQLPDAATDSAYQESITALLHITKLLYDNGITLLPGTDDTTGFTVHREIELYTLAGISNAEALRLGSLGAAEYLGWEERTGAIEPGMLADFFLIDGNPLEDIRHIKAPRMVFKAGDMYFPADIYRALGFRPFGSSPSVTFPSITGQ